MSESVKTKLRKYLYKQTKNSNTTHRIFVTDRPTDFLHKLLETRRSPLKIIQEKQRF